MGLGQPESKEEGRVPGADWLGGQKSSLDRELAVLLRQPGCMRQSEAWFWHSQAGPGLEAEI